MKQKIREIKNFPFKTVFVILLITGITSFLAIIFFQFKLTKIKQEYLAASQLKIYAEELNTNFSEYLNSKREDAFFLYGYSNETEKIKSIIESLYSLQKKYKPEQRLAEVGILENTNRIQELTTNFYSKFEKLILVEKNVGNENYGIIQSLNDANINLKIFELMLQDSLINFEISGLTKLTEIYKKNYSELTVNSYVELYNHLITKVKSLDITTLSGRKEELIKALDVHKTRFLSLSEAEVQIGRNFGEGIKAMCFEDLNEILQISKDYFNLIVKDFNQRYDAIKRIIYLFVFTLIVIPLLLVFWLRNKVKKRIKNINTLLQYLEEGEIENFDYNLETSSALPEINTVKQIFINLNKKNQHLKNIIAGHPSENKQQYELHDIMGQTITELETGVLKSLKERQTELKNKKIEEHRIKEMAKFAKILRKNTGQVNELAQAIISELVEFFNIQIGGFYIQDNSENPPVYRLIANYAYGKEKVIHKTIKHGVGLIGSAASDKTSFYYDDLPEYYLKIITGFGQMPPKSLYIQPLISGERVVGVLELASIEKFEPHQIEFIKSLSTDIAAALIYTVLKLD